MAARLKILVFLLLFSFSGAAFSQTARPSHTLSLSGGVTVPNSSQYDYIGAFDLGVDYTIEWRMNGPQYWKRFWKQPLFGLQFEYLHTNNPIAGQRFGAAFSMRNDIWNSRSSNQAIKQSGNQSHTHSLYWFLDAGCSFYTNPFERTPNEQNDFIGSYVNCLFNLGLGYSVSFKNNSALLINARFSHSSNGYVKVPNHGLNYLLMSVGYRMPQKIRFQDTLSSSASFDLGDNIVRRVMTSEFSSSTHSFMSHRIWLSFAPAIVHIRWEPPPQDYYFAYTGQIGYMFYPTSTIGFGLNLDVMYNYSHLYIVKTYYKVKPTLPYVGAAASIEPRWGPLSIRLSAGYYLVKSPAVTIPIYERLGLFYHFGKSLSQFAGVSIKAHAAHADYIEWHYGVELFIHQPKRCVPAQGEVIL